MCCPTRVHVYGVLWQNEYKVRLKAKELSGDSYSDHIAIYLGERFERHILFQKCSMINKIVMLSYFFLFSPFLVSIYCKPLWTHTFYIAAAMIYTKKACTHLYYNTNILAYT
jgi:hypothetical protein